MKKKQAAAAVENAKQAVSKKPRGKIAALLPICAEICGCFCPPADRKTRCFSVGGIKIFTCKKCVFATACI